MFWKRIYEEADEGSGGNGDNSSNTNIPTKSTAISEAVKAVDKTLEGTGNTEVKEAKKETDKKDDKKDGDKDGELDEVEIKQARQLYLALKDPDKSPILLRFFAEQAGYKPAQGVETKKEGEEVKDEILSALEEHLGEEFAFLSGKLSKALDKIIKVKFDEHARGIQETLEEQQREKLTNESTNAYVDLAETYFNKTELPDNVTREMSKMMDRYKPGQGVGVKEYLTDIFHMAASKLDINLKTSKVKNSPQTEQNRNDAIVRLASNRGVTSSTGVEHSKSNNKPADLKGAIALAKQQIEEQTEKEK